MIGAHGEVRQLNSPETPKPQLSVRAGRQIEDVKMTLSRRAEIVAVALFPMGRCHEVTFRTPSRISPECLEGLEELEKAGMVKITKNKRDGWYCHATPKIGHPMCDFKKIGEDEVFPIVKD